MSRELILNLREKRNHSNEISIGYYLSSAYGGRLVTKCIYSGSKEEIILDLSKLYQIKEELKEEFDFLDISLKHNNIPYDVDGIIETLDDVYWSKIHCVKLIGDIEAAITLTKSNPDWEVVLINSY